MRLFGAFRRLLTSIRTSSPDPTTTVEGPSSPPPSVPTPPQRIQYTTYYGNNPRRVQTACATISACICAATFIQGFALLLNIFGEWPFNASLVAFETLAFLLPFVDYTKKPPHTGGSVFFVGLVSAALVVWGLVGFIVLAWNPTVFENTPLWVYVRICLDPNTDFAKVSYKLQKCASSTEALVRVGPSSN